MSPAIIVQRKTFKDVNNYTNSDTNVLARRCVCGGEGGVGSQKFCSTGFVGESGEGGRRRGKGGRGKKRGSETCSKKAVSTIVTVADPQLGPAVTG